MGIQFDLQHFVEDFISNNIIIMSRAIVILLALTSSMAFAKECSEPDTIANGKFEYNNYPGWPSHICNVVYTCDPGFTLKGNRNLYCYKGEWTAFAPTCEAVICPALDAPTDGSMSYVDIAPRNQMDSIISFSCNDNFELVGQESVVCLPDGTWCEEAPSCVEMFTSCKDIKTAHPESVSGMFTLHGKDGETYSTFCDMETSEGGWTLVASIHENDMNGKCTEGDRWSSEDGVVERHGGTTLWENNQVYGSADQAASDDYKNQGYFEINAEQLMVIQVPNGKASAEFISSATFQYTTDKFLQEYDGNLQGLFKQFPIVDGELSADKDNGPAVRINFVKGTDRDAFHQYGYDMQSEMIDGYMQFRAINKQHGATAFCPFGKMKNSNWDSSSTEHGCFGATQSDNEGACGDFSAFDGIFNDLGWLNNWATSKEMRESAFLILYR